MEMIRTVRKSYSCTAMVWQLKAAKQLPNRAFLVDGAADGREIEEPRHSGQASYWFEVPIIASAHF